MDEVEDLLRIWELPELIPVFLENEINLQALSALTPETITDLIPKIGPRALFIRCWRGWQTEFSSTNITLSALDEDDNLSLQNASQHLMLNLCGDQPLPIQIIEEYTGQLNSPAEQNPVRKLSHKVTKSPVLDTLECRALEKLLKQSLEASTLLVYKGGAIDGDSARNLLVAEIAKEILRINKDNTLRGELYCRWANAIKGLFPDENTTTYYVPACTTANGITLQARGKLVYQVLNQRKRLQKLGALAIRKRTISSDSSLPSSSRASPRPPPLLLEGSDEKESLYEDLNWLHNSSDPWSIVLVKWKNTVKERMRKLHDNESQSIESYIEEFPALKKPHGYILLSADFDEAYNHFTDNLYINYPIVKNTLISILNKRKKGKDSLVAELLELSQSGNEENTNLAGFLSIPHLLIFPATSTSTSKKRHKTAEKINRWKPSKTEARNSFIRHIKSDIEIKEAVKSRYETLKKRGIPPQPFIIIVGENLCNIKSFIVVPNQYVLYERSNIMQAVDTCYKIFWALNAVYSLESYPIWYFIQRGLYKMSSKWDKGSTSVESLLTDCNL